MLRLPLFGGASIPALSLNFLAGVLPAQVSFSRSSAAWYFNSSGLLTQAASGVARFDYGSPGSSALNGLLIEGQSTNLALQSRDLTNASWTKTSATAAKDQTGIDGVANSASSLTATANGGTCLQSVTQASTSDTFSVYIKRITGTGTVKITLDGGTTYTDVTASLSTSAWFRATASETVTNPSIGIQLGTSGDKIAVDVAQLEAQAFASSPIITTSATVTRSADVATVATSAFLFNSNAGTFIGKALSAAPPGSQGGVVSLYKDPSDFIDLFRDDSPTNLAAVSETAGTVILNAVGSAWNSSAPNKIVASYGNGTQTAYGNGSLIQSKSGAFPSGITTLALGNRAGGATALNGWLQTVQYWNRQLSAGQLASQTQ